MDQHNVKSGVDLFKPEKFYTAKEIAEELRLGLRSVYRLFEKGKLQSYSLADGKGYRIRGSALNAYLESREN
jgi:excisionase family DNA binding protein